MKVELPDGSVIEDVPEGTTKEQIVGKLLRAGRIDRDTAAQWMPAPNYTRADLDKSIGTIDRFLIGTGRGYVDAWEGIKQLALEGVDVVDAALTGGAIGGGEFADEYTQEVMPGRETYSQGDLGVPGTVGRVAGNIAPMIVPGGAAAKGLGLAKVASQGGTAARVAATTLGGAGGGATVFVEPGGFSRGENMAMAAVLAPPLAKIASGLTNALGNVVQRGKASVTRAARRKAAISYLSSDGTLTAAHRARIADDVADGFTPEQALRKFELEEVGAVPTRGRVTGDVDDLRFEVDQSRVSGAVADVEQESRRGMVAKMDEIARGMTPLSTEVGEVGEDVAAALKAGRKAARMVEDKAYKAADDAVANMPEVGTANLEAVLNRKFDFFLDPNLAPLQSALRRAGILTAEGVEQGKKLTGEQAEIVLSVVKGLEPKGRAKHLVGEVRNALQKDVVESLGEDVYAPARAISARRFATYDTPERVSAIIEGKIAPEQLIRKMGERNFSAKNVDELVTALDDVDPQLVSQVRGSFLNELFKTAKGSLDQGNVPRLTPQTLLNRLDAIGPRKLTALYGERRAGDLMTFANRLQRAASTDFRTAGPGTAGDLERKIGPIFSRIIDGFPGGQWVTGLMQAASSGAKDRAAQRQIRRALNVQLLARENLLRDVLVPSDAPGVGAAIGAGTGDQP